MKTRCFVNAALLLALGAVVIHGAGCAGNDSQTSGSGGGGDAATSGDDGCVGSCGSTEDAGALADGSGRGGLVRGLHIDALAAAVLYAAVAVLVLLTLRPTGRPQNPTGPG